jgi:hypothetical protein
MPDEATDNLQLCRTWRVCLTRYSLWSGGNSSTTGVPPAFSFPAALKIEKLEGNIIAPYGQNHKNQKGTKLWHPTLDSVAFFGLIPAETNAPGEEILPSLVFYAP